MRIVILSDIHSNQIALEAVLEALPAYDQLWCLGDTIGYGPRPNECLASMRALSAHALTGNHDLGCLGKISLDDFNPLAAISNRWNGAQLTPELRAYLEELPITLELEPDVTLAHASPRDPVWEYIDSREIASANLPHFKTSLCFVGHSHVPTIFISTASGRQQFGHARRDQLIALKPNTRYIFNPGSVGQPRDLDPRAAYLIWDTEASTVQFKRIGYDIAATQRQMRDAALPPALIERIAVGE